MLFNVHLIDHLGDQIIHVCLVSVGVKQEIQCILLKVNCDDFRTKIKQARKEMGFVKQAYLADTLQKEGLNVSQQAVSNLERDINYPYILDFPI